MYVMVLSLKREEKKKNGKGMFKIHYGYIGQTHETHSSYILRKAPF